MASWWRRLRDRTRPPGGLIRYERAARSFDRSDIDPDETAKDRWRRFEELLEVVEATDRSVPGDTRPVPRSVREQIHRARPR